MGGAAVATASDTQVIVIVFMITIAVTGGDGDGDGEMMVRLTAIVAFPDRWWHRHGYSDELRLRKGGGLHG